MPDPVPDAARHPPARRNRTRQRERILARLRETSSHPTAQWLHEALSDEFPRLSLGTVYRNLEILVAEGRARQVPSRGPARFDGNPEAHPHLICESCGAIEDLEPVKSGALPTSQAARRGFTLRMARIDFYGSCSACSKRTRSDRTH